jgi:hypothetical protein
MEKQNVLTPEQQVVLSNPNVLTTFLRLLEGESSIEQIVKRTGYKPLEVSFYLDQMKEVGLIEQSNTKALVGKSMQVTYEVMQPDLDLSGVVRHLRPSETLMLLLNKVQDDFGYLEQQELLQDQTLVKFAQVRIRTQAFDEFRKLMDTLDEFVQQNEVKDSSESMTFLMVTYKTDLQ